MNFIKSQDLLGHPVDFKFNEKGHAHQTYLGGFISLFIRALLTVFAI